MNLKSFAIENMQAQIDAANNERLTQKVAELHRENALLMGEKSRLIEGNAQLVRDNAALAQALSRIIHNAGVTDSGETYLEISRQDFEEGKQALAATEPKRDFSAILHRL